MSTTETGKNRTGVSSGNGLTAAMIEGMERFGPTSHGSAEGAGMVRIAYAREGHRLGSLPVPSTLLADRLGQRLAFERTGTRLYEALLSKHEAYGSFDGGPTRSDLVEILEEEHQHFAMLEEVIQSSGGDPTAITPAADASATAGEGILKVITDARTSLAESLEAILIAELTDREGWRLLTDLVRREGDEALAQRFEAAQRTEEEHLRKVRAWLRASQGLTVI